MPWVVRDAVDEINRAVGRRWQGLDRLLPPPGQPAEGCAAPLVATGANGRPAGLAVCRHERVPDGTLHQTWGTADRFSLVARLREADTSGALDEHVQPPGQSGWIAGMTRAGVTAYLQTMCVRPGERGRGTGAALVRHLHTVLDARGVQTTLLHYAQVNPLAAPFWSRMGYRPLWTGWEVRPAGSLR